MRRFGLPMAAVSTLWNLYDLSRDGNFVGALILTLLVHLPLSLLFFGLLAGIAFQWTMEQLGFVFREPSRRKDRDRAP